MNLSSFPALQDSGFSRVLLYAYPKDSTPGCTQEALDFSRLLPEFYALGIGVFGVSPDSTSSHEKFTCTYSLTVPLLSDPEKTLLKALGAWGEKKNYGKVYEGVIRSTFLLDAKTGEILKEWKNVKAAGHAEKVLGEVKAIVL